MDHKTDKELAVELAKTVIIAAAIKSKSPNPIDGRFVDSILRDCYDSVASLSRGEGCKEARS